MKLFRLVLSILLILPAVVFAQSNYKPAYVLKLNGDTVKGYINYREWNTTPKTIEFKTTLTDSHITSYQASQISGFGISNIDKYLSYTGPISTDDNIFPDLPSQLDTTTKNDTLFLQISYQGKPLSFLSHRDKQKFRYFVQEENGLPVELKMHQYYMQASQLSTLTPYTELLFHLANKYNPTAKNIQANVERTKFSETDLANVIKFINNDKSKASSGTFGTKFFAGIIFSRTTTEFKGQNAFTGQPSTSYIPRLTGGFDFFTNKYTQKLIFRGELTLSLVQASFKLGTDKGAYPREYAFNQLSASFSPQVLYSIYNTDNLKFYIGAGVGLNLSTYPKNAYTTFMQPTPLVQKDYYGLSNYWINFPIRAGIVLNKKLDINLLYAPPTSYSDYLFFSISNTVYGLGVNYRLGK